VNLALWIAAGLLAVVALVGGISKTFVPVEKLAKTAGGRWTADAGVGFVRTLGVLELLAAVGLVLPAVVDVAPAMVAVTAVCWVVLMIGAIVTHVRYHDGVKFVVLTSLYLALAAFVAWGRFGPGSFTA
jgi:DoxX-like family